MAGEVFPTQGQTLSVRGESALGTGTGTLKAVRFTELTAPDATRHLVAAPNGGHAHSYDKSQPAIPIEMYRDSALSFTTNILRNAATGTAALPPVARFMKSGGCNVAVTAGDTTLENAPAADSLDLVADYGAVGECVTVELPGDKFFPTLAGAYAATVITPQMDLPAVPITAKKVIQTFTVTPYTGPITATDTLEFVRNTRGKHTTAPDLSMKYNGCACASVGELTIKPNESPTLSFNFHMTDVVRQADTLAAETFDSHPLLPVIDDNFEFGFANAGAAGLTRAVEHLLEAKFKWGWKSVPVIASGGGSVSGLQGYMQVPDGVPIITITTLWDKDFYEDMESSDATASPKYMHFIQPFVDSAGEGGEMTAWGLFLPKCRITPETPHKTEFGEQLIKVVQTYQCSGGSDSALASTGLDNETRSAPWFFCQSGQAT